MFSKTFATDLLKLIYQGTTITGLARDDLSPLTSLYMALHTGDPGAAGTQSTSEVTYTGYARVAVPRDVTGFTVTDNVMNPTQTLEFGEMTGGTNQTATHMTIGTAPSGGGKVLARFTLSPSIDLKNAVTPRLRTTTSLTLVTS